MNTLVECPDLPVTHRYMTNFDHQIDDGMEDDLRNGMRSHHAAWNFCAYVWFANGEFHSQIMRYGSHVETLSDQTLRGLMVKANERYGNE